MLFNKYQVNSNTLSMNNICAIIVTYHPDINIIKTINLIINQVKEVIIVDNNSGDNFKDMMINLINNNDIYFIYNRINLGIAKALNQGINYAILRGYTWTLLLDQDSIPYFNMVETLIDTYYNYPIPAKLGIIGSNYKERNIGWDALHHKIFVRKQSWYEMDHVITSGSLISLEAYNNIGPFREDFFIYFVDIEYCLRLKRHGYKVIITKNHIMSHNTGNAEIIKILWREVAVLNYQPERFYYIIRNGLLLCRENLLIDTKWTLNRLYSLGKRLVNTLLFQNNKMATVKYFLIGIYHAVISKMGSLK